MSERPNRSLSAPSARDVDLRLALSSQIFDSHVVDGGQVLDLIFGRKKDWAARIEARDQVQGLLVASAILAERDSGIFFRASIVDKLEAGVVAALGCEEEEARRENVDARTRRHCVEKLNLHSVHILLREV